MNILLIADQTLFREGVKRLLALSHPLSQVTEANGLKKALGILESQQFDFVLLDIKLKDAVGLDSLRAIMKTAPKNSIIAIAEDIDIHLAELAMSYGASAYISKTSTYAEVKNAIAKVTSGKTYLPPELKNHVNYHHATRQPASDISILSSLSERQKEVLSHIAKGSSNKRISEQMNISQNTVKAHLATIFKVLGVHNRTEAFYFYARAGAPVE